MPEANHTIDPADLNLGLQMLLQLRGQPQETRVEILKGELVVAGKRTLESSAEVVVGTPAGIIARIGICLRNLGIADGDARRVRRVCKEWTESLRRPGGQSWGELLAEAREVFVLDTKPQTDVELWSAALKARLLEFRTILKFGADAAEMDESGFIDTNHVILRWPLEILSSPGFTLIESLFPGLPPISIDDVWVPLRFIDADEYQRGRPVGEIRLQQDQRFRSRMGGAFDPEVLLEGIDGVTVIVGEPGGGKTTLLKWLARGLIRRHNGPQLLPLWVPLREYSMESARRGLVDFALRKCGVDREGQRNNWTDALRQLSKVDRRIVVLMLDGWDEVGSDQRDLILGEIDQAAKDFAIVVTTRPAGFPKRIRATRFLELVELEPEDSQRLARTWLGFAEADEGSIRNLENLIASRHDLQRLARNPFLLTVLCGVFVRSKVDRSSLPTTRAGLYDRAIEIIAQRKDVPGPALSLSPSIRKETERLAWWLMAEAGEAPQFLFDRGSLAAAEFDTEILDRFLTPYRLVSQWDLDKETLHFVHATFQEHLAACYFATLDPRIASDRFDEDFLNMAWFETFALLAGHAENATPDFSLWREVRSRLKNRDRFGQLVVRAATLLGELHVADGGQGLVGSDLLEEIWKLLHSSGEFEYWLRASCELDPQRHERFCGDSLQRVSDGQETKALGHEIVRSLRDMRTAASSKQLLDLILDTREASSKAAYGGSGLLPRDRQVLRDRLRQADWDFISEGKILNALVEARDQETVEILGEIVERCFATVTPESFSLLSVAFISLQTIGGSQAFALLVRALPRTTGKLRDELIEALGSFRTVRSRDRLMELLVETPVDNPSSAGILKALLGHEIYFGGELVLDYLQSTVADVRSSAARLAAFLNCADIAARLVECAANLQEDVRVRSDALSSLRVHARPEDAVFLHRVFEETGGKRNTEERVAAIEAVVGLATRELATIDAAAKILGKALRERKREITCSALVGCARLPTAAFTALFDDIVLCATEDPAPDFYIVRHAIRALARADVDGTASVLEQLLRSSQDERVRETAGDALATIDPVALLGFEGDTVVDQCLQRFSMQTGSLVFRDHIVDATGRRLRSRIEEVDPLSLVIEFNDQDRFTAWRIVGGKKSRIRSVDVGTGQNESLFRRFFDAPNHTLTVREIVGLLWPGSGNNTPTLMGAPRRRLRQMVAPALSRLRKRMRAELWLKESFDPLPFDDANDLYQFVIRCMP